MASHLLFECNFDYIHQAKIAVQNALGIQFVLHDSLHYGGDYYLYELGEESFRIFLNQDFEGESIADEVEDISKILLRMFPRI